MQAAIGAATPGVGASSAYAAAWAVAMYDRSHRYRYAGEVGAALITIE